MDFYLCYISIFIFYLQNTVALGKIINIVDQHEIISDDVTCPEPFLTCPDGICLPPRWVCDGEEDCSGGEDELPSLCSEKSTMTKKGMIPKKKNLVTNYSPSSSKDKPGLKNFNHNPEYSEQNLRNNLDKKAANLIQETHEELEKGRDDFFYNLKYRQRPIKVKGEKIKRQVSDNETSFEPVVEGSTTTSSSGALTTMFVTTNDFSETTGMVDPEQTSANVTSTESSTVEKTATSMTSVPTYSTTFHYSTTTQMDNTSFTEGVESQQFEEEDYEKDKELEILMEIINELKNLTNILQTKNCSQEQTTPVEAKRQELISKLTCPDHFQFIVGRCIYVQVYPPVTWEQAASICNSQNGHLLTLHSYKFFKKLLMQLFYDKHGIYPFWVGARSQQSDTSTSIKWRWLNNYPLKIRALWGIPMSEREDYEKIEKPNLCAFLDGNLKSYLNAAKCQLEKGFICQYNPYST